MASNRINNRSRSIAVRLPHDLANALDAEADRRGVPVSRALADALRRGLSGLGRDSSAPLVINQKIGT